MIVDFARPKPDAGEAGLAKLRRDRLGIRAGHAATLETAGFRLGALIAGGFFIAPGSG